MSYRLFDTVIGNDGLIEEEKKKILATSYLGLHRIITHID